jgi:Leucine-rich repeat (LRR) protein
LKDISFLVDTPHLQKLTLCECRGIQDSDTVIEILNRLTRLVKLDISCIQIQDLEALTSNTLKMLDLRFSQVVTLPSPGAVPKLERLLFDGSQLTEQTVSHFQREHRTCVCGEKKRAREPNP